MGAGYARQCRGESAQGEQHEQEEFDFRLADLASVPEGDPATSVAEVVDIRVEQTWRRRVQRTTAYLRDDSGEIIGLLREVWGEYTELNII